MTEPPATAGNHSSGSDAPDAPSASAAPVGSMPQLGSDAGNGNPRLITAGSGPANSRNLARLAVKGWALYILSWFTPSSDGQQFGAAAFVDSVRVAWHLLGTGNIFAGLCVALGWLANFSVLPWRLPTWLRIIAIAAPWLAFAVVLAKLPARATYFLYFYPWALGIALIQAARCSSMKAAS